MRKIICLFLLAFCLLLTACAPAAQPEPVPAPDPAPEVEASAPEEIPAPEEPTEPELSQRDADWIEDIEFLREEYKARHLDPFYYCPEEEFDWKLDQLITRVGELSDSDIFYELDAIISGMGDTHTQLWWDGYLPICDRLLAINMFPLNGKLYLGSCLEESGQFEPYLLHEIVGVNGVNSLYLMRRGTALVEPFNWNSETEFPQYPSFFDWVGCDYREGYTIQILNDNQEVESLQVPVITLDEWMAGPWIKHENWASLVYAKGGDRTAYYEGPDGGCIQWCIGEMWYPSTIRRYLAEVAVLLEEHPDCSKLAIDLRGCPGGSAESLPFLEEVRAEAGLLEGKQVYVLTGGGTASSATRMIALLKDEFNAVTVGEPTAQFSSFFSRSGEDSTSVLPHSQIKFKISDLWRDSTKLLEEMGVEMVYEEYYDEDGRLYQWETCIQPDVYVHMDIEDLRQGKDTVIEWVLAQ